MRYLNDLEVHQGGKTFFEALGIKNNFISLPRKGIKLHEPHKNVTTVLTNRLPIILEDFFVSSSYSKNTYFINY